MEEVRVSLKKSLRDTLKQSIEMVGLRSSAIIEGNPYERVDGDDSTAEATYSEGEARLLSSAHMELMKQLKHDQERSNKTRDEQRANNKTRLPSTSSSTPNNNNTTTTTATTTTTTTFGDVEDTLRLCQDVADGQLEQTQLLLQHLEQNESACLLLLRCNTYWPLLTRAVIQSGAGIHAHTTLLFECLCAVSTSPLSAAVLHAQLCVLDHEILNELSCGLAQCGGEALTFALSLARLYQPKLLIPLLCTILDSIDDVQYDALLNASLIRPLSLACVLCNVPSLVEQSTHYMLMHGHTPELLYTARKSDGAQKTVLAVLNQVRAKPLRAALRGVWRHGLTPARYDSCRLEMDAISAETKVALKKLYRVRYCVDGNNAAATKHV
jgi:hypothetical protein